MAITRQKIFCKSKKYWFESRCRKNIDFESRYRKNIDFESRYTKNMDIKSRYTKKILFYMFIKTINKM